MTTTYDKVIQLANSLQAEGKYYSTYSAVLAIYLELTGDTETKFDSTYSIVATIADGVESGDIDLGGGGGGTENTITKIVQEIKFFDYKGDIVAVWDFDDRLNKTELPAFPENLILEDGTIIIPQEWNWTLEEIKTSEIPMNVGLFYDSPSNKIGLSISNIKSTELYIKVNGTIDWGDGIVEAFDNISTEDYPHHTYSEDGDYIVTITGEFTPYWQLDELTGYNNLPNWYYSTLVRYIICKDLTLRYADYNLNMLTYLDYIIFNNELKSLYNFECINSNLPYVCIPKSTKPYVYVNLEFTNTKQASFTNTNIYGRIYLFKTTALELYIPNNIIDYMPVVGEDAIIHTSNLIDIKFSYTNYSSLEPKAVNSLYPYYIKDNVFYTPNKGLSTQLFVKGESYFGFNDIDYEKLNITSFCDGCFEYNKTINSIKIPSLVTTVDLDSWFPSNCSIYFHENVKTVNSVNTTQKIHIPENIDPFNDITWNRYSLEILSIIYKNNKRLDKYAITKNFNAGFYMGGAKLFVSKNITNLSNGSASYAYLGSDIYFEHSLSEFLKLTIPSSVYYNSYNHHIYINSKIIDGEYYGDLLGGNVIIPEDITDIKTKAFASPDITSITLHDNITSIGQGAFSNLTNLHELTIPSSVTSLSNNYAYNCNINKLELTNLDYNAISNNYSYNQTIILTYTETGHTISQLNGNFGANSSSNAKRYLIFDFTKCTVIPSLQTSVGSSGRMKDMIVLVPSSLYDEWINETNWSALTDKIVAI